MSDLLPEEKLPKYVLRLDRTEHWKASDMTIYITFTYPWVNLAVPIGPIIFLLVGLSATLFLTQIIGSQLLDFGHRQDSSGQMIPSTLMLSGILYSFSTLLVIAWVSFSLIEQRPRDKKMDVPDIFSSL